MKNAQSTEKLLISPSEACEMLTSSGNLKNDEGLSTKTIRSMILMIKKSLHAAMGADIINKNPAEYIILPKLQQKPVEYLTPEQIWKLINVSRGERWGIFFPLAFMTACRISELGALRKSSLKHENGIYYLSIEGSLNRVKNFSGESNTQTVLCIGSTKNSRSRQIPIPKELVKLLHQHFEKQDKEAAISCGQYHFGYSTQNTPYPYGYAETNQMQFQPPNFDLSYHIVLYAIINCSFRFVFSVLNAETRCINSSGIKWGC